MDATYSEKFRADLDAFFKLTGATQCELADASGVSQETISNIRNGKRLRPAFETVMLLREGMDLLLEQAMTKASEMVRAGVRTMMDDFKSPNPGLTRERTAPTPAPPAQASPPSALVPATGHQSPEVQAAIGEIERARGIPSRRAASASQPAQQQLAPGQAPTVQAGTAPGTGNPPVMLPPQGQAPSGPPVAAGIAPNPTALRGRAAAPPVQVNPNPSTSPVQNLQTAQAPRQPTKADAIQDAQEAMSLGADPQQVFARLQQLGITPEDLAAAGF